MHEESWGYTKVRPKVNLFWWLYYIPVNDRPLVLWLQGGPGASGVGLGNFQEIGPMTEFSKPRKYTWLKEADLLFVDSPVGTGFSYTDDPNAYTKDVQEITDDLIEFFKQWLEKNPQYEERPFYIISESYGGKMAAALAKDLDQKIKAKEIKMNLRGVALGDSWISPIDYVKSWGYYLYAFSFLSDKDLEKFNGKSKDCEELVNTEQWAGATTCWAEAENLISELTNGVDWYNVMDLSGMQNSARTAFYSAYRYPVRSNQSRSDESVLEDFMNGKVRKKLGIIPDAVHWTLSSNAVFDNQEGDFMKPVIDVVDHLLNKTDIKVVVFSGQLDLICDVVGTEMWVEKLKWGSLKDFLQMKRSNLFVPGGRQVGYYKALNNFSFYWILNAGHMVPTDSPEGALEMLRQIIKAD